MGGLGNTGDLEGVLFVNLVIVMGAEEGEGADQSCEREGHGGRDWLGQRDGTQKVNEFIVVAHERLDYFHFVFIICYLSLSVLP